MDKISILFSLALILFTISFPLSFAEDKDTQLEEKDPKDRRN